MGRTQHRQQADRALIGWSGVLAVDDQVGELGGQLPKLGVEVFLVGWAEVTPLHF